MSSSSDPPERVLITGFCDWQRVAPDGQAPPDPWTCRRNPSGAVLVGELAARAAGQGRADPPLGGPLVRRVRDDRRRRHAFRLAPVRWGALTPATAVTHYDVRVHLGLGVYDDPAAIQLERGAWPHRRGVDVDGLEVDEPLGNAVREPPPAVAQRLDGLDGRRVGDFTVRVAAARPDNVYLCNETHWHALGAAGAGHGARAWFVHVPDAPPLRLAEALAALIAEL